MSVVVEFEKTDDLDLEQLDQGLHSKISSLSHHIPGFPIKCLSETQMEIWNPFREHLHPSLKLGSAASSAACCCLRLTCLRLVSLHLSEGLIWQHL